MPEFQREFTWNRTQSRDLIDSMLRGYPTGSLLFWRTNDPPSLKNMPDFEPNGRVHVLLDGQQRLTVLYLFIKDSLPPYYTEHDFDSSKDPRELYYNLMTRAVGYYKQIEMANNPLWVRVADCFKTDRVPLEEIAAQIASDSSEPFPAVFGQLHRNVEDIKNIQHVKQTTMYVKDDASLKDALEVFHRVNSGGTPLTEADIALAHMCSAWADTRREFKKKLEELNQQGFYFNLTFLVRGMNAVVNGRAEYRLLYNLSEQDLIAGWSSLSRLLDYLVSFLRNRAYIQGTVDLSTTNVLIPIIGYLSQCGLRFKSEVVIRKILYWMYAALYQRRYSGSVDQKLEQDLSAITSGQGVDSLLAVLREDEGSPMVTPQALDSRGVGHPYYDMTCVVIRASEGKDWATGLKLEQLYGGSYNIQRHHIFPHSLLQQSGYDPGNNLIDRQRVNEIANRVPLTQCSNMDIFTAPPVEYLPKIEEANPGNLARFMIPLERSLWEVENYEVFLAERRRLIAQAINNYMDGLINEAQRIDTDDEHTSESMIERGENEKVEFKMALRFNPRTGEKDKNLEYGVIKSIAAFLNSGGGTVFVGVRDDAVPVGLEMENFPNNDKLMLHVVNLIKERLGPQFPRFIKISIERVNSKEILRVDCQRSPIPVFMKHENEEKFYIRCGPSSSDLPLSEAHDYIQREFYQGSDS